MMTDPACRTIVRSVIDLGRNLGLEVLAEGIETAETAASLQEMGCHLGQGYLYGRPMPAAQFEAWLAARHSGRDEGRFEVSLQRN